MRRFFTKKRSFVALAAVAVLAIAGGAYAYFTSSGSGSTTANVGGPTNWNVAPGAASGPALVPDPAPTVQQNTNGSPALPTPGTPNSNVQVVLFTVTNPSTGDQKLNSVSVAISPGSLPTGCTPADFSVDGASPGATAVDNSLNNDFHAGQVANGTATIEMIDSGLNQNACQGAHPLLTLTAN
jgi:hypothetical protein